MPTDPIRDQLLSALDGGHAYMTFEDAVANFPPAEFNTKPANVTYSFWHVLDHMCRVNRDILDYIREDTYRSRTWPDDYWAGSDAQADEATWNETLRQFRSDLEALRELVADPATDLSAPVRNAGARVDHTLAREALLVIEHNAYHIGEFAVLRQVTGAWPTDRDAS